MCVCGFSKMIKEKKRNWYCECDCDCDWGLWDDLSVFILARKGIIEILGVNFGVKFALSFSPPCLCFAFISFISFPLFTVFFYFIYEFGWLFFLWFWIKTVPLIMSFYDHLLRWLKLFPQINFQKEATFCVLLSIPIGILCFNSSRLCKQWNIFFTFLVASFPNYAVSKFWTRIEECEHFHVEMNN